MKIDVGTKGKFTILLLLLLFRWWKIVFAAFEKVLVKNELLSSFMRPGLKIMNLTPLAAYCNLKLSKAMFRAAFELG